MNNKPIYNIAATIIFEGSALNRDQNIGGNVQSIKKLTFADKQISFISRAAIRHYLFNTLRRAFEKDWQETPLRFSGSRDSKVLQFDLLSADILTSAELDAFGYMYTISGNMSITRKAPVGITKAVSLFPYNQDLAFYANHDMVRRSSQSGIKANPNPYQKEENLNLFKVSFTIDADVFGRDIWAVKNLDYKERENIAVINISSEEFKLNNLEKEETSEKTSYKRAGKIAVEVQNNQAYIPKEASFVEKKEQDGTDLLILKESRKKINIEIFEEEQDFYKIPIISSEYKNNTLTLEIGIAKILKGITRTSEIPEYYELLVENNSEREKVGELLVERNASICKLTMNVDERIKRRRIAQILCAIRNGLVAHSSGEDNTIIPLFMIAAPVKIPSPIFHPYIYISNYDEKLEVRGLLDCINNRWLVDKVFVMSSDRLKTDVLSKNTYDSFEEFLNACGLDVTQCALNNTS